MSRNRDFNFRAPPPPAPTLRITPPPPLPTRSFSGMDSKVMTGELKMFTLTQAQIFSGVRESAMRSGTSSSLTSVDWAGTRSGLIPSSTGSTVSSLTPKLSTLNLSPSTVTSLSGSSLSLSSSSTTSTSVSSLPASTTSYDTKNPPLKKFVPQIYPGFVASSFGKKLLKDKVLNDLEAAINSYISDSTNKVWFFDNVKGQMILGEKAKYYVNNIKIIGYIGKGSVDMMKMGKSFKHVEKMYFKNMDLGTNNNWGTGNSYIKFLEYLDLNLEYLSLAHNKLTFFYEDKTNIHFQGYLPQAIFRDFPKELVQESSSSQTTPRKIKALDLSHNEIADAGFMNIISGLKGSNLHLEYLDVTGNKIGSAEAFKTLIYYMKSKTTNMLVAIQKSSIKTLKSYLQDLVDKAQENIRTDYVFTDKNTVKAIDKYKKDGIKFADNFSFGFIKCVSRLGYVDGFGLEDLADELTYFIGSKMPKYGQYFVVAYLARTAIYCAQHSFEDAMISPEGVNLGVAAIDLLGALE